MLEQGWALARSMPSLDGGQAAAAPQLTVAAKASPTTIATPDVETTAVPTTVTTAPAATAPPSTAAPTTTTFPLVITGTRRRATSLRWSRRCGGCLATASNPAPVPSNLRPALAAARNRALPYTKGCVNVGVNARPQPCEFGVPGAERTILLYGDSHAVQCYEPLELIARRARLPPGADRRGRLPGDGRGGADARVAPHVPAAPGRRDLLDRDEQTGAGRGLQLLQPLPSTTRRAGPPERRRRSPDWRPSPRALRRHRRQPVGPIRPAGVPVRPPRRRIGVHDRAGGCDPDGTDQW